MGLLDDAIREHLDLKRQHGADPAEIERAEREALGPVRRGPEEAGDLPLEPAEAADLGLGDERGEELDPDEQHGEAERESPLFDHHEIFDEEAVSALPEGNDETQERPSDQRDEPSTSDQNSRDPERSGVGDEPDHRSGAGDGPEALLSQAIEPDGDETVEFDVEREEEVRKQDEDVLEETPEFLQDTPDHDRLWFEQRPPRDFDFDG